MKSIIYSIPSSFRRIFLLAGLVILALIANIQIAPPFGSGAFPQANASSPGATPSTGTQSTPSVPTLTPKKSATPSQPTPTPTPNASGTPSTQPIVPSQPTPVPTRTPTPVYSPPSLPAPVAYWTFNEGSGTTANDSSGNGNTGTLQPGAGWATGKVGPGALNLSGANNSYVDVPRAVVDTSKSYSVAAWVKLNNITNWHTAVSIDGTNISGFYLQYCYTCGTFSFNAHPSDSTSAPQISANATIGAPVLGQWYHLVGIYDGNAHQLRLYVNGQLQGTQSFTGAWQAGGHTEIGRAFFAGPVDFWPGQIDDVRIYNSVLSQHAISMLAQR